MARVAKKFLLSSKTSLAMSLAATAQNDARIRAAIRSVPKGKVATYGSVAYAAGLPGAARRVAWILRGAVGLPWQRIVGAGGQIKLNGESGAEQRFRLQTEGVSFRGLRVDMKKHEHSFAPPRRARSARNKR